MQGTRRRCRMDRQRGVEHARHHSSRGSNPEGDEQGPGSSDVTGTCGTRGKDGREHRPDRCHSALQGRHVLA